MYWDMPQSLTTTHLSARCGPTPLPGRSHKLPSCMAKSSQRTNYKREGLATCGRCWCLIMVELNGIIGLIQWKFHRKQYIPHLPARWGPLDFNKTSRLPAFLPSQYGIACLFLDKLFIASSPALWSSPEPNSLRDRMPDRMSDTITFQTECHIKSQKHAMKLVRLNAI